MCNTNTTMPMPSPHKKKSSSSASGSKYNSSVMRLVLAVMLSAAYHIAYNIQKPIINNLSPTATTAGEHTNSSSSGSETSSFIPHWEMITTIEPYMGNLTCVSDYATYLSSCPCCILVLAHIKTHINENMNFLNSHC